MIIGMAAPYFYMLSVFVLSVAASIVWTVLRTAARSKYNAALAARDYGAAAAYCDKLVSYSAGAEKSRLLCEKALHLYMTGDRAELKMHLDFCDLRGMKGYGQLLDGIKAVAYYTFWSETEGSVIFNRLKRVPDALYALTAPAQNGAAKYSFSFYQLFMSLLESSFLSQTRPDDALPYMRYLLGRAVFDFETVYLRTMIDRTQKFAAPAAAEAER
ncbi:MAG: hypothetical protein LBS99_02420 [Clostridiales bacterium]|jgi:hypothetical protein|nr:hypothetical protein [Clostridiales bacterium]